MDRRRIAASLALGTGALLLVIGVYRRDHPLASSGLLVKPLPNVSGDDDDHWRHFELTVPPGSPPLDIHLASLIDGKGEEYVYEVKSSGDDPFPFKYRLDALDDYRLEGDDKAQGFKRKKNVVTYYFSGTSGPGILSSFSTTVRFKHGQGGSQERRPFEEGKAFRASVGQKVVLENRLLMDTNPKGYFFPLPDAGPIIKTPAGVAHRMDVYVMFQRHLGPPSNGTVARAI